MKTAFFLFAALVSSTQILPSLCAAEASPNLDRATAFVAQLDGDPFLQGQYEQTLAEQWIEAGALDAAEEIARSMKAQRAGIVLADVARACFRHGKSERGEALLALARTKASDLGGARGEAVLAHAAAAEVAAGRGEEGLVKARALTRPEHRTAALALCAQEVARRGGDFRTVWVDGAGAQAAEPDALGKARLLYRIGMERLDGTDPAKEKDADVLFAEAEEALGTVQESFPHFFVEIGLEMWKRDQARGEKLLRRGAVRILSLNSASEHRALLATRLIPFYAATERAPQARQLLEGAEKIALELQPMEQPKALAAVAGGWWQLREKETAAALWVKAAGIAARNPNPVMQARGGADICLAAHAVGAELSAEVRAALDAIGSGGEQKSEAANE